MIHYQKGVNDILEAVAKLPAKSLILALDDVQFLDECKRTNGNVVTCLRHFYDKGQQFDGGFSGNIIRAREFFATFIDETFRKFAHNVDFVKGFNEYLANSQSAAEVQARLDWAEAAATVWMDEYRSQPEYAHIRLAICSAAIGNDIPVGFAEIATNLDCVISYHAYSLWKKKVRDPGDFKWLSGRWNTMDQQYRAAGYTVDWIFTEAGPFESAVTGWRSPECLGFDRNLYVESMKQWINDMKTTDAYKTGRLNGFALFTSGRAGDTWKGYWTEQPELNILATMVAEEWKPGDRTPPPPPPPPPPDEVPYVVVVNLLPQDTTIGQKVEVVEAVHDDKETILQSADDAARLVAPGQPGSVVKVWEADHWTGDIEQWLTDRGVASVEHWEFSDSISTEPAITDIVNDLPKHATKRYGTRKLTDITTLTIHHTVGWATGDDMNAITAIANFHVNTRGWPGIGYHYVIPPSGVIYQTNYDETWSYHVGLPGNGYALGVALGGDFTNSPPTEQQLDAAKSLITYKHHTLIIEDVTPHRLMENAATACPGNTWEDWFWDLSSFMLYDEL